MSPTTTPSSRAGVFNALRSVSIRARREWCAKNGGCAKCLELGRPERQAARCAGPAHWTDTQITKAYTDLVVNAASAVPSSAPDTAVVRELTARIAALEAQRPVVTTVQIGDARPVTMPKGTFQHSAFKDVLRIANTGLPIMLVGPTGSGKSELAKQIAHALGRSFAFDSVTAGISEGVLMGRLLPTGDGGKMEYHRSKLVAALEDGGVYAAEEFDAIDANTALVLNNLLAGDTASVPHRVTNPSAKKHREFTFIACANTYGTGADRMFVGRGQLDAATLSRFDVTTVFVDYDPTLETALIPASILAWVRGVRQVINEHKMRRTCSTRTGVNAKRLEDGGETRRAWVSRYFASWTREELARVPANLIRGEV